MNTEKKLRLNKETIRNLSDENLEQVAGGKKKGGGGGTGIGACDSVVCNSVVCGNSNNGKLSCICVATIVCA